MAVMITSPSSSRKGVFLPPSPPSDRAVVQPARCLGTQLNSAISDIYEAGMLIQTLCEGVDEASREELAHVTEKLDMAIRQIRVAVWETELHRSPGVEGSGQTRRLGGITFR
jgi:hypothetical protein